MTQAQPVGRFHCHGPSHWSEGGHVTQISPVRGKSGTVAGATGEREVLFSQVLLTAKS